MVRGGITAKDKLEIKFVDGKMDWKAYISTSKQSLFPFFCKYEEIPWIFQQDNAPIHVSKESRAWFFQHKINLLSDEQVKNLISSMPDRIYELILNKGKITH